MSWLSAVFIFLCLLVYAGYRANQADWGSMPINMLDGLLRLFCRYFHRLQYEAPAIPDEGAALIACNHLSGLDPLLIITACRRPVRFLIAREEYERFGLQWLFRAVKCIPVDRHAQPEKAFRAALAALADGEIVALFPEGGIHTSDKPPKKLKAGVYKMAAHTSTPIYPLSVCGISGEGHTLLSLVMPGQARLFCCSPLHAEELTEQQCLHSLQHCFRKEHKLVAQ